MSKRLEENLSDCVTRWVYDYLRGDDNLRDQVNVFLSESLSNVQLKRALWVLVEHNTPTSGNANALCDTFVNLMLGAIDYDLLTILVNDAPYLFRTY